MKFHSGRVVSISGRTVFFGANGLIVDVSNYLPQELGALVAAGELVRANGDRKFAREIASMVKAGLNVASELHGLSDSSFSDCNPRRRR